MGPVFLSGNQRSGKTLVQLVLGSHPDVAMSPGCQVLASLLCGERRGTPLDAASLLRLRRTLQKDRKFKAWRVDHAGVSALVDGYARRPVTSADVVLDLLGHFRDQTKPGARIVGNKKGFYCRDADLVRRVLPDARFVFLVRDPRDAVASMLDTQPEHDLEGAAITWTLKARRIRALEAAMPGAVTLVRYEAFVREPEAACRRLCAALDLPFVPAMLEDYRTNDAARHRTDTTHAETYEPITTSMIGAWRARLAPADVALVEAIAGDEMEHHGYARAATRAAPFAHRARAAARLHARAAAWWAAHARAERTVG